VAPATVHVANQEREAAESHGGGAGQLAFRFRVKAETIPEVQIADDRIRHAASANADERNGDGVITRATVNDAIAPPRIRSSRLALRRPAPSGPPECRHDLCFEARRRQRFAVAFA
jgi:hypothetical protein